MVCLFFFLQPVLIYCRTHNELKETDGLFCLSLQNYATDDGKVVQWPLPPEKLSLGPVMTRGYVSVAALAYVKAEVRHL